MTDVTLPEGTPPGPSSWRDVYSLVRDTRTDLLGAVTSIDTKVDVLTIRVNAIEDARIRESGRTAGRADVFGFARSSIAIAVSMISAAVAILAVISK